MLVPLGVGLLVLVLYVWWSLLQWHRWEVPSWDLGIFTQLAKSYAAGDGPVVHLKGHGANLLGDHFHPVLVLLGPVYALFPSALTLLVVQDLNVGVLYVAALTSLGVAGIVLGAWGCGVFGNDPGDVATAFAVALREQPWFDDVVFAVLDRQPGTPTLTAFARVHGAANPPGTATVHR